MEDARASHGMSAGDRWIQGVDQPKGEKCVEHNKAGNSRRVEEPFRPFSIMYRAMGFCSLPC